MKHPLPNQSKNPSNYSKIDPKINSNVQINITPITNSHANEDLTPSTNIDTKTNIVDTNTNANANEVVLGESINLNDNIGETGINTLNDSDKVTLSNQSDAISLNTVSTSEQDNTASPIPNKSDAKDNSSLNLTTALQKKLQKLENELNNPSKQPNTEPNHNIVSETDNPKHITVTPTNILNPEIHYLTQNQFGSQDIDNGINRRYRHKLKKPTKKPSFKHKLQNIFKKPRKRSDKPLKTLLAEWFVTLISPPELPSKVTPDTFYVVSAKKFILLQTMTFGLYSIYWFWQHWYLYKNQLKAQKSITLWATPRALFNIFFTHALFININECAKKVSAKPLRQLNLAATIYVVTSVISFIASQLPQSLPLVVDAVLLFICLIALIGALWQAQYQANIACGDIKGTTNNQLSYMNYGYIVIGAALWLMVIFSFCRVVFFA